MPTDARPGFVAYEYTTARVRREHENLHRDVYGCFGWQVETQPGVVSPTGTVTLRLKRDRAVANRTVLAELQRRCLTALGAIEDLERSRTSGPTGVALAIGLVGSGFLAGSVFSFEASLWVPFVLCGVLGLTGWALAYPVYSSRRARRAAEVAPLIEKEYDTISTACEQAAGLLS